MKSKKLKLLTILLFLLPLCVVLLGAGCEKDDESLWEISPDSKNTIIQKEVNGIKFKFCLLNEAGEAATVFNEGENFSFYFSVDNNSNKDLNFDAGFAQTDGNDFCRIYNLEDTDLGKPYDVLTVLTIGAGAYPFDVGETYMFEVPWSDERDAVWFWEKGTYESTHQEFLEKGSYYTGFKYCFQFTGEEPVKTDTLSFKINFEIQ